MGVRRLWDLGQEAGAQEALICPQEIRGCDHTTVSSSRYVGGQPRQKTWRGSYVVQEAARLKRCPCCGVPQAHLSGRQGLNGDKARRNPSRATGVPSP